MHLGINENKIVCSQYEKRIKTRNNRSYIRHFTCLQPNNSKFYNELFGSLSFRLYVHIMKDKIIILIMIVITSLLFVTLLTFKDFIGTMFIGFALVFEILAYRAIITHKNEQ